MREHSTIREAERWDAQVGRWVPMPTAPVAAPAHVAPAPAVQVRAITPDGRVPAKTIHRMYAGARSTRSTAGFGTGGNTSADAELSTSLTILRTRARQMVRDGSYAKRAKKIVVDNVIGAGVGMQAQVETNRAGLNERVNTDIEQAFASWAAADSCHTGGKLHFHDLERAAFGNLVEAGEVLIRLHRSPFGSSRVPLALELIEPERLGMDMVGVPGSIDPGNEVRMGVEVDRRFQRPQYYWIRERHPGDIFVRGDGSDRMERVPAADVFHLYIVDRWPQTRGEPWLHTALRKLDELNEYTGLEVSAARGSAAYFATITTPESDGGGIPDEEEDDGSQVMDLQPLTIQELNPGEKLDFHAPNRPNSALDPFMRAMLREIAAGAGVSYESLSRDYSQSNYSSSRMGLLEDRDLWRVLQAWWLRSFRLPLHKLWLQQAVLAGAVSSVPLHAFASFSKYESVRFKPRGWTWVDPTKEVTAYKEAVKAGFTTVTDVVSATSGGLDIEDTVKTRRRELDLFEANNILVDTTVSPEAAPATPGKPSAPPADDSDDEGTDTRRSRVVPIGRTA